MAENFDAQSIGLRAQKKLLGKMTSRRVISAFIDDTSSRLLNNLYRLGRDFHGGDRRTAEKTIRRLIKTVIKTGILYRNDQFNACELDIANDFRKRFRVIAMTLVSFYQVDYTYDAGYLTAAMSGAREALKQLVCRHLTDKSLDRIDSVFDYFGDREFLDTAFRPSGPHRELMGLIIQDLNTLLENNVL
jgi:hypothetical protein